MFEEPASHFIVHSIRVSQSDRLLTHQRLSHLLNLVQEEVFVCTIGARHHHDWVVWSGVSKILL